MSFDPDAYDAFSVHERRARRRPGSGDAVVSSVLLVLLMGFGALLSFTVLLEQMGVAACSENLDSCDFALVGVTTWITPAMVVLFAVPTLIALARRSKTSGRAWWIPALGLVITFVAFLIASALVSLALQGATG